MLRVSMPRVEERKTETVSANQTKKTDFAEKFEDYLNSEITESRNAKAVKKDKASKRQDVQERDTKDDVVTSSNEQTHVASNSKLYQNNVIDKTQVQQSVENGTEIQGSESLVQRVVLPNENQTIGNTKMLTVMALQQEVVMQNSAGAPANSDSQVLQINAPDSKSPVEVIPLVGIRQAEEMTSLTGEANPVLTMQEPFLKQPILEESLASDGKRTMKSPIDASGSEHKSMLEFQANEIMAQSVSSSLGSTNSLHSDELIQNNVIKLNIDQQTRAINQGDKGISKMAQNLPSVEKFSAHYVENKENLGAPKEYNREDSPSEIKAGLPTDVEAFTAARVYSGKENGITAMIQQDNIIHQVTNSIATMCRSDNRKFTMELSPEALGKITVEMAYSAGGLDLKISADSAVTTKVLTEQIVQLKNALTANHVDVRNIDVNNSSGFDTTFVDLSRNFNPSGGENRDTDHGPNRDRQFFNNNTGNQAEELENGNIYYRQNQLLNYLV